jgi:hypothetical protein
MRLGLGLSISNIQRAAATFDPLSVGTPLVYYDLRQATQSGGNLATLPDSSGNGRDATITSAPGYTASNSSFGNLPTMDFPGSDTKRVAVPSLGTTTGALTIVAVASMNNANAYVCSANATGDQVQIFNSGQVSFTGRYNPGAKYLSKASTPANPNVIVGVANGGSSKIYVSAYTPTTGDAGTHDLTGSTMLLGNYLNSVNAVFSQQGSTAFFVVYSGALSQANVEYLLDGFGALAGITIGA